MRLISDSLHSAAPHSIIASSLKGCSKYPQRVTSQMAQQQLRSIFTIKFFGRNWATRSSNFGVTSRTTSGATTCKYPTKLNQLNRFLLFLYILYIYSLKYSYKYLNILKISTTYYNSSIYPVQTIYNWKTRINLVSEILFSFVVNGELNRWKLKGDSMKAN